MYMLCREYIVHIISVSAFIQIFYVIIGLFDWLYPDPNLTWCGRDTTQGSASDFSARDFVFARQARPVRHCWMVGVAAVSPRPPRLMVLGLAAV